MDALDSAGDASALKHLQAYRDAQIRAFNRGRRDAEKNLPCDSRKIRDRAFRPDYRRGWDSFHFTRTTP